MLELPNYINIIFGLTLVVGVLLFLRATKCSKYAIITIVSWFLIQTSLGLSGFYKNVTTIPPRVMFMIVPPMLFVFSLFILKKGRGFIDKIDPKYLIIFHTIRIPIEIALFLLFTQQAVPKLMTFEGRNFDVLIGITAPLVYYFGYYKNTISKSIILIWNFIGIVFLLNIVVNALLSTPSIFQQFAFEQPNIAILHYPFNLLPSLIVPLVFFSHLVVIKQIIYKK